MKIYTRYGDHGQTQLLGGVRVSKTDLRIQACGDLDELSASLGWSSALSSVSQTRCTIANCQEKLFEIGAAIANPKPEKLLGEPDLRPAIAALEKEVDQMQDTLEPLRHFILPGGAPQAAALHLSRAVCRRAERTIILLLQQMGAVEEVSFLPYLNRLSDWLFVAARVANKHTQTQETRWGHS